MLSLSDRLRVNLPCIESLKSSGRRRPKEQLLQPHPSRVTALVLLFIGVLDTTTLGLGFVDMAFLFAMSFVVKSDMEACSWDPGRLKVTRLLQQEAASGQASVDVVPLPGVACLRMLEALVVVRPRVTALLDCKAVVVLPLGMGRGWELAILIVMIAGVVPCVMVAVGHVVCIVRWVRVLWFGSDLVCIVLRDGMMV